MSRVAVEALLEEAFRLDAAGLDAASKRITGSSWLEVAPALQFQSCGTGGGCSMLVAALPGTNECQVALTDGEGGDPQEPGNFWLGILDSDGEELYALFVRDHQQVGA